MAIQKFEEGYVPPKAPQKPMPQPNKEDRGFVPPKPPIKPPVPEKK